MPITPETGSLFHAETQLGVGRYSTEDGAALWRRNLTELSTCPNVVVKIGGLGMPVAGHGFEFEARPARSHLLAEAWRPHVETCIELFSPERSMFESNFPVDKQSCSYTALWNSFKIITSSMSVDERQALFFGTAARTYNLELANYSTGFRKKRSDNR